MKQTIYLALAVAASAPAQSHEHAHAAGAHSEMEGHWMAPAKAAKRRNPIKADAASWKRGEALFHAHCASCHGEEGAGDGPAGAALNPKPANLQEMAGRHGDGDLAWKIAQGRSPMPGWKGTLKSRQIWDLVNYIRHLGGSRPE